MEIGTLLVHKESRELCRVISLGKAIGFNPCTTFDIEWVNTGVKSEANYLLLFLDKYFIKPSKEEVAQVLYGSNRKV
jgi:hypothetical protein